MDETYEIQTENERQQQQQERTDNTMTYSNMTQKNDVFRSKLTLIANIQGIPNFTFERLCHDLSTRQPRAWKHVLGVQPIQRRTLEIQFDNEQALTHIQRTPDLHTRPTTRDDGLVLEYSVGDGAPTSR